MHEASHLIDDRYISLSPEPAQIVSNEAGSTCTLLLSAAYLNTHRERNSVGGNEMLECINIRQGTMIVRM